MLVHFNLQKEDNLSVKYKMAGPKTSAIQRFHCSIHSLEVKMYQYNRERTTIYRKVYCVLATRTLGWRVLPPSRGVSTRVVVPETGLSATPAVGGGWKEGDLRDKVVAPSWGLRGKMELGCVEERKKETGSSLQ